mgnify:CR=1 FL=1
MIASIQIRRICNGRGLVIKREFCRVWPPLMRKDAHYFSVIIHRERDYR